VKPEEISIARELFFIHTSIPTVLHATIAGDGALCQVHAEVI
jgi:hypothetical protein